MTGQTKPAKPQPSKDISRYLDQSSDDKIMRGGRKGRSGR